MAKEFTAESVAEQAAKKTQASKYGILNTMTVDQLKRAKGVLNAKLKNNKNMSIETKNKIEGMLGEYNRTERQIGKYWQTVTRHPNGKALLAGRGKTLQNLTIQNIKGLKSINDKDLGKIDRNLGSKVALGIGIGMAAVGAGFIGKEDMFGILAIIKLFGKNGLSWNNQLAIGLIAAGGLIAGGAALANKMKKSKDLREKHQAEVNAAENEAFEEASKGEEQTINAKMSEEEILSIANDISQNPDLTDHYMKIVQLGEDDLGNKYSLQQRQNYLAALRKVDQMNKEFAEAAKSTENGQLGVKTSTIEFVEEKENTGNEITEEEIGDVDTKKKTGKSAVTAGVKNVEQLLTEALTVNGNSREAKEASIKNLTDFITTIENDKDIPEAEKKKLIAKAKARQQELETKKALDGRKAEGRVSSLEEFEKNNPAMA